MKKPLIFLSAFAALFLAGAGTSAIAGSAQPAETKVAAEEPEPTLYEQLGGEAAVKAAVDGFYVKVLADDRVNGFFKGVDMDRQRAMQTAFLTFAFGGPNHYEGKDLRAAHSHLVAKGLNDTHFDVIIEHLGSTLKDLGVKDELIKHAADVANSVRGDILGKEKPKLTLYEQLGGEAAVKAAVDGFYVKVLADDRVNGFFKGVDMDRQRAMQTAFLTFAFGGPNSYAGKDLRAGHAHLVAKGLNDTHFDVIIEHLGSTLKELGVKDELIQRAADVANSVRGDILGKEKPKPNLYEQLGGEAAVKAAVDGFYVKVLADDRVNGFFKGVDMDRQRAMQTAFLTFAFGGPNSYAGKDLRAGHAHLVAKGLNDTHFDIILEHLGSTLKELGVKDELIQRAAGVANSVRGDILGKEKK